MRKKLNEGQRFGKLVVTLETNGLFGCKKKYKCFCDCGNITWSTKGQLVSGSKRSCGCLVKNQPDPQNGQHFGRLVSTGKENGLKGNKKKYECVCDCGKTIWVPKLFLYRGDTQSCGCWKKEVSAKILKENQPKGIAAYIESKKEQRNLTPLIHYIDPEYPEDIDGIKNNTLNTTDKVHILCTKCGSKHIINICNYITTSGEIIREPRCPRCIDKHHSKEEDIIIELVREVYNGEIIENWNGIKSMSSNGIKSKKEIDLYIPELHLGIEYNSFYYHSTRTKDINYHYRKYIDAKKQGIYLIQVWENQLVETYLNKLKSYILYIQGKAEYQLPFSGTPKTIKVCNDFPLDFVLFNNGYKFIEVLPPKRKKLYRGEKIYNSGYSIFRKETQ